MLLSTLPDVPGRQFELRGMVIAEGFHGIGGSKLPAVMQSIAQQAVQFGANAVIDIKVVRTGEHSWVVTGTAVVVS